jgi:4-aminobutyrate aminotransferase-like enzyme
MHPFDRTARPARRSDRSGSGPSRKIPAPSTRSFVARAARRALRFDGERLDKALHAAFDSHPKVGDIRSGKGLLAAVELVEDKATKKGFDPDKKIGARLMQEMSMRG